jgi:hypothetical protein
LEIQKELDVNVNVTTRKEKSESVDEVNDPFDNFYAPQKFEKCG